MRYWRRVSALGLWVKCTRNGARNLVSSGNGARGALGYPFPFLVTAAAPCRRLSQIYGLRQSSIRVVLSVLCVVLRERKKQGSLLY